MGFEVPAAMGVKIARPDGIVWSVAGDGGFQMTMSELATIVENDVQVKFAIMNNNHLGMITQWQELFYMSDYQANAYTRNPDFVKLAEAFDILGLRATRREEVPSVIAQAMAHTGPVVIDIKTKHDENCFPMVPPGAGLGETIDLPGLLHEEAGVGQ